ncbi:MAG: UDP-N-acetylmuramoyl-tripeptide--D-alanyl-D-alanine ligase [Elusimicrobiota bacterium]|nr:UDP-N-acetylmuramoyl-tripeptide--D-alanyl-D-alanine ligase [Elusimicrobiota bacterium]
MEKVILKDLVRATCGKFIFGDPAQQIIDVSTDTRKLHRGDIFFALKGKNYDGHQFVPKAIEEGASGIVVERVSSELDSFFPNLPAVVVVEDTLKALGNFAAYYRRQFSPIVIGVTGSNGKTTTKEMIYSILNLRGKTLANFGSFNNLVGVPLTIMRLNSEFSYCVFELGISLKGEMETLIEITKPQIGLITNIGKTHLEFLKSQDDVFLEKSKLVNSLSKGEIAILNIDDAYLARLRPNLGCNVITYGFTDQADVYPKNIELDRDEIKFELLIGKKSIKVTLHITGKFNISNALAASAVAYAAGVDLNTVKTGLERFAQPQMRMEKIQFPSGAVVINDAYNANPDSMRASILSFVETYPDKKKIVVLGDMLELGEHSESEHKLLGKFLVDLPLEEIYLYGEAMKFVAEVIPSTNVQYFKDWIPIIAKLKSRIADPQVVVLFKASRAMMLEKIIDGLIEY